ncbi:maleylpyruvate isomerase family mycothiol-dependent enzyme [Mycolicibacterium sp.]|uniref:maleylpyruvate isomerase family mycothiol-dependent enzyme n=1 Tax=Mycolicibacterium sp. TaxID=2320850 RepID=UPI0025ED36AB|nr:maleylpyruvate isomerase family mycothiol-dependent enzyme [Mycolicibacterium sp.]
MADSERPRTVLDKGEVLEGLFASWDSLDSLLSGLTDEQWRAATSLPGWTVHDVVAHIAGTELMLAGEANPEVDITGRDHVRNDIGALNERWVEHLRAKSPAEMLAMFRDTIARRKATLSAMPEAEWNTVTFTPAGPDSYGRFMRVRVFDCWFHEHDIREALGLAADDQSMTGPDSRLALDEMESSMAFVVGKKGQAPEGSRVMIALTGPLSRVFRVAVDGRAALVADFGDAQPTAIIGMDGLQFTRLAGGRPMLANRPKGIDYGGDEELGARIVEKLAYVI